MSISNKKPQKVVPPNLTAMHRPYEVQTVPLLLLSSVSETSSSSFTLSIAPAFPHLNFIRNATSNKDIKNTNFYLFIFCFVKHPIAMQNVNDNFHELVTLFPWFSPTPSSNTTKTSSFTIEKHNVPWNPYVKVDNSRWIRTTALLQHHPKTSRVGWNRRTEEHRTRNQDQFHPRLDTRILPQSPRTLLPCFSLCFLSLFQGPATRDQNRATISGPNSDSETSFDLSVFSQLGSPFQRRRTTKNLNHHARRSNEAKRSLNNEKENNAVHLGFDMNKKKSSGIYRVESRPRLSRSWEKNRRYSIFPENERESLGW